MNNPVADQFLKSFFDKELYFLADKTAQSKIWSGANGDHFGVSLMLFSEAWLTITERRRECKLREDQFQMVQKLYDMIRLFQLNHVPPETSGEYQSLLSNPEWHVIQKYAKEVYDKIARVI